MKVDVYNLKGEKSDTVDLPDEIFAAKVNVDLMHQAYLRQMANARLGSADTKTRGEVAGGGKKIWKQKGTGHAWQGSIRAPHWRHGGIVFGPHPRSYEQKMPRKMRRQALRSALSAKAAEGQIVVLDELTLAGPKTKEMESILDNLQVTPSVLILLPAHDEAVEKSASNLPAVKTLHAHYLNVRDLLGYDYVLMPKAALAVVESFLGQAQ